MLLEIDLFAHLNSMAPSVKYVEFNNTIRKRFHWYQFVTITTLSFGSESQDVTRLPHVWTTSWWVTAFAVWCSLIIVITRGHEDTILKLFNVRQLLRTYVCLICRCLSSEQWCVPSLAVAATAATWVSIMITRLRIAVTKVSHSTRHILIVTIGVRIYVVLTEMIHRSFQSVAFTTLVCPEMGSIH